MQAQQIQRLLCSGPSPVHSCKKAERLGRTRVPPDGMAEAAVCVVCVARAPRCQARQRSCSIAKHHSASTRTSKAQACRPWRAVCTLLRAPRASGCQTRASARARAVGTRRAVFTAEKQASRIAGALAATLAVFAHLLVAWVAIQNVEQALPGRCPSRHTCGEALPVAWWHGKLLVG